MIKIFTKIIGIAIFLFIFQITLTAQPIGSKLQIDTNSHISYWDGVSAWISIAPGIPGQNLQFLAGVPTWINNPNGITTAAVTAITGNTAVSGATILTDGGDKITARGVCWSTTANPTVALTTKTTDGSGIGSFTSNITGLTAVTTYFARAYASNSAGTAYGNEVSFTTNASSVTTVTDFDGNIYDTIQIGTQVWMKQNLKTTHYKNGTAIPNVVNSVAWSGLTTGARCYYNNDSSTYAYTYGALYNWFTVNTGNLCPTGWHVPTDVEWTSLTSYLSNTNLAGGKLKEAGLTHWLSPNVGATNETNFTALPGGSRLSFGLYDAISQSGFWWCTTELDATYAWIREIGFDYQYVGRSHTNKPSGFSVRCLKD